MVPRRVYTTGRKTYAKGQTDRIKGNRFMNVISLKSIKVEDVHEANPMDKTGEFFFEVDDEGFGSGKGLRIPQFGEIQIELNKIFTSRQDFTLWMEFAKSDKAKTKTIKIKLKEADKTRDDTVIDAKIPLVYGSGTKYEILRGKGVKIKLKISSSRTRF